ncbi:alginate O-acetyltransferase AlgX-related protein [Primorskyibacter sp. 2E107]|uniref:alginate O-acetyltransferase AlgX-related protein n=1 Tax=Primorskyibacter sp. 2E107 TaxID=3403458 RepID=UPI003AF95B5A
MTHEVHRTKTGQASALALAFCASLAMPVSAQSSGFGCEGLYESDALPSVEGDGGMFYRIDPDLMMAQGLTEGNVAQIAALSRALAARGTTLVYLPMPTKALGQPWQLPPMARYLGYDVDVATTVYDQSLKALSEGGIVTLDARATLARAGLAQPSYFGADPRLSSHGAAALSEALAEVIAGVADYPAADFTIREAGPEPLFSTMRLDLQESCSASLPIPTAPRIVTDAGQMPGALQDGDLARIALIGTEMSGAPATGLAQRLQAATGLTVAQYTVPEGGPFAAMSSYLTSDAFRAARPDLLIWEHPIRDNLADGGDQPMRELIAAAGPECTDALPVFASPDGRALRADLSALAGRDISLRFDSDSTDTQSVRFVFLNERGHRRIRQIHRHEDAWLTGRFFVPMSGLWPVGLSSVEILPEGDVGREARLFACPEPEVK